MNLKNKPIIHIQKQGKAIIEIHSDECLIMLPNREILIALNYDEAKKKAERYFKKHLNKDSIGIGEIETRNKIGISEIKI